MLVNYKIHRLQGFIEIPPRDVPFEEIGSCPICDSENLTDVCALDQSLISAWCNECYHLFDRKRPGRSWYHDWYHNNWDTLGKQNVSNGVVGLKKKIKQRLKHRLGLFARKDVYEFCQAVVRPGSSVLDVGCGYGTDLAPFVEHGCRAYGLEASPHRTEAAASQGIRAATVRIEDLNKETFDTDFDLVFANHVLEHIVDPHQFITIVKNVLKEDGYLCVTVPNFSKDFLLQHFFFALHIHCFSKHSLTRLLEDNGFVVRLLLEENQIRVLAQYKPREQQSGVSSIESHVKIDLDSAFFIKRCFRKHFQNHDGVFLEWTRNPKGKRIEQLYRVTYSSDLGNFENAARQQIMELSFQDGCDLPMQFQKQNCASGASFWVK